MVPADLHELLQGFVSESLDNLDDNEIRIGRLSNEDNDEDLKSIFRIFHTLKGLTGFFKLNNIKKVTHEAETLLDIYRKSPKPIPSDTVDLLFVVFDFLREAIGACGVTFSDDDYVEQAGSIIEQITNDIARIKNNADQVENMIGNVPLPDNISMPELKTEELVNHPASDQNISTSELSGDEIIKESKETAVENKYQTSDIAQSHIDIPDFQKQVEQKFPVNDVENEFVITNPEGNQSHEQSRSLRDSIAELKLTIDYQELIQAFVSQVLEKIYDFEANTGLLMETDNTEVIQELFRLLHSIKSPADLLNIISIKNIVHETETFIDYFRSHPRAFTTDEYDLVCLALDLIKAITQTIAEKDTDEEFIDDSKIFVEKIHTALKNADSPVYDVNNNISLIGNDSQVNAINDLLATDSLDDNDKVVNTDKLSEDSSNKIIDKSVELIHEVREKLQRLAADPHIPGLIKNIMDSLYTVKNIDFIKEDDEMQDIINSLLTIIDSVLDGSIEFSAVKNVVNSDTMIVENFILTHCGYNNVGVKQPNDFKIETALIEPAPSNIINTADNIEDEKTKTQDLKDDDNVIKSQNVEPLQVENIALSISAEHKKADNEPVIKNNKQPELIKPVNSQTQAKIINAERKEVRVSTEKLNMLFDLVGEIITIETMLVNNKDLSGLKLPNFRMVANMMNKLTRELQKITMSIRMIPLESLFNKMSRMVRDISKKFNKVIELEVFGQETEMDKNVIEELSDPLVHIIRNSIDHGIEYSEERKRKGKPAEGKIILGASYQGNEIHIVIQDDGAGLNRDKIIEKAIERGLIKANPDEISDKDVWPLIFEPGLSTAKEVTEISGRGVGMDVVKKNIEKLRGTIDVESKKGLGTKITFRIPLTLAIMDAMLVRVGTAKYAIPILSVRESFQPRVEDITHTMDGVEVVKVRNQLYPIIRLHEIMRRKPDHTELEKGILMMLNSHDKTVCLFVDQILGQQQAVVKPLSDYIGDVQGVTGCMIMSDGKIGLILDVENLILKAENFVA